MALDDDILNINNLMSEFQTDVTLAQKADILN